jgi:hypothetical protein
MEEDMAEGSGGNGQAGGSAKLGFLFLAAFMALSAWGGWEARGKMDACSDRPDYGAFDLGQEVVVATWDGISGAAVWTKDAVVGLYHKIAD